MPNQNPPTAIIVGSGPGGLASALLLAHSGVKVTVLEKAEAVGGRTRLFKKDGYTFDRGPTFFHYPEVIEEIFQNKAAASLHGAVWNDGTITKTVI